MFVKVEYDEKGCFLEAPYLFGEDEKYAQYMQVGKSDSDPFAKKVKNLAPVCPHKI